MKTDFTYNMQRDFEGCIGGYQDNQPTESTEVETVKKAATNYANSMEKQGGKNGAAIYDFIKGAAWQQAKDAAKINTLKKALQKIVDGVDSFGEMNTTLSEGSIQRIAKKALKECI